MPIITIDVHTVSTSLPLQGGGPIATAYDVEYDDPLSMCGVFSFKMPARDSKAALLLTQKSAVRIFEDGTEMFLGIVERKQLAIGPEGIAIYEVSGRSFLAELEDDSVNFLGLYSGTSGVTNAPTTILNEHDETWSLDAVNGDSATSGSIYARLSSESCLLALVKVSERLNEHFVYRPRLSGSDRKIIWIQDVTGTASGVRAIQGGGESVKLEDNTDICLIQTFEELEDGIELVNVLIPFGGGDDLENAALTIAAVDTAVHPDDGTWTVDESSNNRVTHKLSTVTNGYREREKTLQFPDIVPISNTDLDQQSAANMLVTAAKNYLLRYSLPHKFYRLSVLQLPASVLPGQTINVVYYEAEDGTVIHNIDDNLIILNIRTRHLNEGGTVYELTVAETDRFPASDTDAITSRLEQSRIYESYRVMGPSVDTISYAETFDDTTAARLDFWLGGEIAQVQQVLLRFKIDPLRSTVESVADSATSSGSVSGDETTGASSKTTSTNESTHTHGIASPGTTFYDIIAYHDGGTPDRNLTYNYSGAQVEYDGSDVGNLTLRTEAKAPPYTSTSDSGSAHGHNMEHTHEFAHVHTVTPVISTNYGLYEDTGASVELIDGEATLFWQQHLTSAEYYVTLAGPADPGITKPLRIKKYSGGVWTYLTEGSQSTLTADQWAYADGESPPLGFSTIYVRISGDVDPETLGSGNLVASYNLIDEAAHGGSTALETIKAELAITVNAETESTTEAELVPSAVSGWWELDVTDFVSASTTTFRPTAATHYITCQALSGGGGQGRITAQLQIRALIQAVAYS